jgi:acyl-coenzyme A thioesterase PaaI-like protein
MAMTHGGILATILDEAMSWAITNAGDLGVTARMSLEFRRPADVGDPLLVTARVVQRRGRLIDAQALLQRETDGATIAAADGRFMRVTQEQAAAWREAYAASGSSSAFAVAARKNAQQ